MVHTSRLAKDVLCIYFCNSTICSSFLLPLTVTTCLRWTKQLSQRYQVTTVHFKNSRPLYHVCFSTALETCQKKTGNNLPNLQRLRVKFAFRSHFWGHMSHCFVYDGISILGDGMFPMQQDSKTHWFFYQVPRIRLKKSPYNFIVNPFNPKQTSDIFVPEIPHRVGAANQQFWC